MTLRLQPIHPLDTSTPPSVRTLISDRDPRAALFVIGLVAASPSGIASALSEFARRVASRRSGQW